MGSPNFRTTWSYPNRKESRTLTLYYSPEVPVGQGRGRHPRRDVSDLPVNPEDESVEVTVPSVRGSTSGYTSSETEGS